MQTYVTATDEARRAVAEIVQLAKSRQVEPLVGFDLETAPIVGLEGYPGTVVGDDGELIAPKKRDYQIFCRRLWRQAFNDLALVSLGLHLPEKDSQRAPWDVFGRRLAVVSDDDLAAALWTPGSLSERLTETRAELEDAYGALAGAAQRAADLVGRRGWKTADRAEARLRSEVNEVSQRLAQLESAIGAPKVEVSLLRHVAGVATENRVKVDPVKPGLDPFTSDIAALQVTLRRTDTGELLSWVFNTLKVDLYALSELLDLDVVYVGANIKFDLKLLLHHFGRAPHKVFCTRVASRILTLGLRRDHSLAGCARRFCGIELSKETRMTFVGRRNAELTPEQVAYAFTDTEVLFPIYDAQRKLAEERGQWEVVQTFCRLSRTTARWEVNGYAVDTWRWLQIANAAARARDEVATELEQLLLPPEYREIFGTPESEAPEDEPADEADEDSAVDLRPNAVVRISQRALVAELLGRVLGLEVESLKKDARGKLEAAYRAEHGGETHPFFRLYAQWSKLAKQASTYGVRFLWAIHPLTKKVHPTFTIAGTNTGRYTSTRPNLLNIPAAKEEGDPDFRGAFLAPAGHKLLGADFGSMELRIAGCVTEEAVLQRLFASGKDGHTFTAAMMFHLRPTATGAPQPTKTTFRYGTSSFEIDSWDIPTSWTPEQRAEFALSDDVVAAVLRVPKKLTRSVAKTVTFLWLFRGGAYTLAERTGLPEAQCQSFFDAFAGVYPRLNAGMDQLAEDVILHNVEQEPDGTEYAWAGAYGGLRRWFEMPLNPSRSSYGDGWAGNTAFYNAQRQYQRELGAIRRESCNVPMQGGNAVITAEALVALDAMSSRETRGVSAWLAIYDELIVAVPRTVQRNYAAGLLESVMLAPADKYMTYIPAEAEAGELSDRWVKS